MGLHPKSLWCFYDSNGWVVCRYFTVPFMMVLLHMAPPTVTQATLTLALYALVNIAAIYMFLFRPFVWPDGSIARFMY